MGLGEADEALELPGRGTDGLAGGAVDPAHGDVALGEGLDGGLGEDRLGVPGVGDVARQQAGVDGLARGVRGPAGLGVEADDVPPQALVVLGVDRVEEEVDDIEPSKRVRG